MRQVSLLAVQKSLRDTLHERLSVQRCKQCGFEALSIARLERHVDAQHAKKGRRRWST